MKNPTRKHITYKFFKSRDKFIPMQNPSDFDGVNCNASLCLGKVSRKFCKLYAKVLKDIDLLEMCQTCNVLLDRN